MTQNNQDKSPLPKSSLLDHLKVFGIALVFGCLAYAGVNILYFAAEFLGLNG